LATQRLVIGEADEFPELARELDRCMTAAPIRALRTCLSAFGAPSPSSIAERTFFNLATYGMRFIIPSELPSFQQRKTLSAECVRIFLRGCTTTHH
jgi:hypothetical protein